eukprot:gnl/MRDRNA2_/MRDRNA2_339380_c0_seq1.p1 gnl/MRDRNA2_/MRDRNA2_339380_c0~~gnl/MRDRNA2_/MRDRNA2_339380_c0_seq1.p1  ORF type:complete len:126 (-),score=13.14 gnl/MRDRNA2_/MRDRNA2_339380_c0_seq1:95-472(-)
MVLVDTHPADTVSVLMQLPQFFLITLGEVLVSPISLDYFYSQAPAEAKAFVGALALVCVSVGDLVCGLLYQVVAPHISSVAMLLIFSGLMLVNALAMRILAIRRIRSESLTNSCTQDQDTITDGI